MSDNAREKSRGHRLAVLLLKVGLATCSVLLVALCFEVGLRILGYEAIYEIYSKPSALWRADAQLGWHHEPNSTAVFTGPRPWPIEFETPVSVNSLGLRGPDVPPRDEDDVRLLFMGDSMVAAMEVEYDKIFPTLIGKELAARTGRSVRSINAGVRGFGTDQSYLYYRDRGKLLEPDLVIFFHSHNDLVNNRTIHRMRRAMGKSAFVLRDDGSLQLVGSPVPDYPACSAYSTDSSGKINQLDSFATRWFCRGQMVLFDRSALFSFVTLRVAWDPDFLRKLYYVAVPPITEEARKHTLLAESEKLTLALLRELDREVEESGAKLIVTGMEDQLAKDLGFDKLRELGIEVLPVPKASEEEYPFTHFKRDSHFNERGHRRVVDALLPDLERVLRSFGAPETERP